MTIRGRSLQYREKKNIKRREGKLRGLKRTRLWGKEGEPDRDSLIEGKIEKPERQAGKQRIHRRSRGKRKGCSIKNWRRAL